MQGKSQREDCGRSNSMYNGESPTEFVEKKNQILLRCMNINEAHGNNDMSFSVFFLYPHHKYISTINAIHYNIKQCNFSQVSNLTLFDHLTSISSIRT